MPTDRRRAAVLGSPVAHSLSPVLHSAAYAALGLEWSYDRVECDEQRLPGFVADLGEEWVGLSVTMPGKRAALAVASSVSSRAEAVGAANTLVRGADGWFADCTDIDGVVGALRATGFADGVNGVILGAGGTACAALAAFAELGIESATVVVRDPARAVDAVECAEKSALPLEVLRLSDVDLARLAVASSVLVNTVPPAATAPLARELSTTPHLLDVIYHPWPTPLAEAVTAAGGRVATGLDMLLHQAFGQVTHFTGAPAPRAAMRSALREATGALHDLPL
ncbi:shikimate dehydrogenase [Actinokineospora auranticolor]|uniref:Shikimate dehydrogenase n=1 Tax=Actinokineospora auranticolor TaxID=155976 RepID=A0A2S6GFC0_9PSEU|nr:shikimate dehydrogenase [Actinokineospora auranticolor]PPK63919.1 shikimate dehydrogenase [Actinokineospora auranticolor]